MADLATQLEISFDCVKRIEKWLGKNEAQSGGTESLDEFNSKRIIIILIELQLLILLQRCFFHKLKCSQQHHSVWHLCYQTCSKPFIHLWKFSILSLHFSNTIRHILIQFSWRKFIFLAWDGFLFIFIFVVLIIQTLFLSHISWH